ncbi:rod shape-determining protein MreD [Acidaminobacter sp. JC074]|uniref:rod shape-determining protein MreD n=1 Tax=Acidaminobacter sp. JC074 TaxID=2530199 RepID=UPI001F1109FE|nr:rod shape-determining protein MreD [Acidaminobacter sp. JC074]MCH4886654.1 rod shape-determining protein MreD [Acidaminobacter sp. JC074]
MINSDIHIKYRYLFLIIVINYILQSTIFQAWKLGDISANLTLVLVIVITIIYGLEKGLFTAVIAGLFVDVFLSMAVGINLFILVIISVLISIIGRPLFTGNRLTLVFMTGVSTLLYHLMYFFFMYFLNKGVSFSLVMTHIVPMEIVLNSIACVLIYHFSLKWIERYKLD